jgi:hypothetical protein
MRDWKEFSRAESALREIDPDEIDDETLMALAADCLTAGRGPRYLPYIRCNDPASCPLRYDWYERNVVGIRTTDREVARQWVIDAMRLGYVVSTRAGNVGTLPYIREQARRAQTRKKSRMMRSGTFAFQSRSRRRAKPIPTPLTGVHEHGQD